MSNKRYQGKVIFSSVGMNSENKVKFGLILDRQYFVVISII